MSERRILGADELRRAGLLEKLRVELADKSRAGKGAIEGLLGK